MLKKQIESTDQITLFQEEQKLLEQLSLRPKVPKLDKMDIAGDTVRRYKRISLFVNCQHCFVLKSSSTSLAEWGIYS
jgi:hypothetical protein